MSESPLVFDFEEFVTPLFQVGCLGCDPARRGEQVCVRDDADTLCSKCVLASLDARVFFLHQRLHAECMRTAHRLSRFRIARVRMGDDPDAVGTPVCVLENMASSKVVMDEIDHLEAVANAVKNRMAFGGGRHET